MGEDKGPETVSAEAFAAMMPISEAFDLLSEALGDSVAASTIKSQLDVGLIKAFAEHAFHNRRSDLPQFMRIPEYVLKEAEWTWATWVWKNNQAEISFTTYGSGGASSTYKFFGIRVERDHLAKLLPSKFFQTVAPLTQLPGLKDRPEPPKHPGGAPRKDFWDRLWADIGARLYVGDLKPTKQADIEKAMLDWAAANGENLGEQSARTRARLIWAAIKEKDKN